MNTRQIGAEFEHMAQGFLEGLGWVLLEKNWHCRHGELDLIMEGKRGLLFVEVKGRRSGSFGAVVEALTTGKVRRLKRTVSAWRDSRQNFRPGRLLYVGVMIRGGLPDFDWFWIE